MLGQIIMNDLVKNSSFFCTGGVVGRLGYLLNGVKMSLLTTLAFAPVIAGGEYGFKGVLLGSLVSFAALVPVIFFGFHCVLKRLRDIRGTSENEIPAVVTTFIFLVIPYIGLVPFLCLFLVEGAVTGNGNILSRLEASLHSQSVYGESDGLDNVFHLRSPRRESECSRKEAS